MGWSGSCNCKASYGVGAHLRIGFVNPVWDTATDTPEMPADPLNGAGGNSKILRDVMILLTSVTFGNIINYCKKLQIFPTI